MLLPLHQLLLIGMSKLEICTLDSYTVLKNLPKPTMNTNMTNIKHSTATKTSDTTSPYDGGGASYLPNTTLIKLSASSYSFQCLLGFGSSLTGSSLTIFLCTNGETFFGVVVLLCKAATAALYLSCSLR